MMTPFIALLSAAAAVTPAHASPQTAPANPNRFGYPEYDPTARRVGDKLCFAYIQTGASRTTDICIPTRNFADTLDPRPDMSTQAFAGNELETDAEQLAKCHIRRREDPGLGSAPTEDPAMSYQLDLRCPSRRDGGGHYTLSVAFNRDFYLPYRLADTICGPDRAVVGSNFDQYVRSALGEPTNAAVRDGAVSQYYWAGTGTAIWLSPNSGSGRGACDNPTTVQVNWSGRISIADATWDAFNAYLANITQEQRDGSFTRF